MKPILNCVFFGDSICFGQKVSIHRGWVPRIAAELAGDAEERGFELVVSNHSKNGNTTRMALERIAFDLQAQEPGLVLVQFGMNDCNHWVTDRGLPRVSQRSFQANLAEIVGRCLHFGAQRVLVHTNHPTVRDQELLPGDALTYEQSNRRYNELIREVAAEFSESVILNDMEAHFLEHTGGEREALAQLLDPHDELHLSPQGHDLYFSLALPVVRAALEQVRVSE